MNFSITLNIEGGEARYSQLFDELVHNKNYNPEQGDFYHYAETYMDDYSDSPPREVLSY